MIALGRPPEMIERALKAGYVNGLFWFALIIVLVVQIHRIRFGRVALGGRQRLSVP
jgi:hypothetical protein